MTNGRASGRRLVVARVLATVVFMPFLLERVIRRESWAEQFVSWGYPDWGANAVSVAEIAGIIALWIHSAVWYGIGVLALVLLGACYTWIATGVPGLALVPFGVLLAVAALAFTEYNHRRERTDFRA